MICQNCNKNDATLHMKRIINGSAAEVHLCSDCARSLGYGEAFSGFGLGFGHLLGELLSSGEVGSGSSMRCPACGKSFEEIAEDGKMGCAECYAVFYDRLLPSLNKIHGKAAYMGTKPQNASSEQSAAMTIEELKLALGEAVERQDFELAATLRDKINEIINEGGEL
jgi:protein arginine kinase activator